MKFFIMYSQVEEEHINSNSTYLSFPPTFPRVYSLFRNSPHFGHNGFRAAPCCSCLFLCSVFLIPTINVFSHPTRTRSAIVLGFFCNYSGTLNKPNDNNFHFFHYLLESCY